MEWWTKEMVMHGPVHHSLFRDVIWICRFGTYSMLQQKYCYIECVIMHCNIIILNLPVILSEVTVAAINASSASLARVLAEVAVSVADATAARALATRCCWASSSSSSMVAVNSVAIRRSAASAASLCKKRRSEITRLSMKFFQIM